MSIGDLSLALNIVDNTYAWGTSIPDIGIVTLFMDTLNDSFLEIYSSSDYIVGTFTKYFTILHYFRTFEKPAIENPIYRFRNNTYTPNSPLPETPYKTFFV